MFIARACSGRRGWVDRPANQELGVFLRIATGKAQITDLLWTGPPAPRPVRIAWGPVQRDPYNALELSSEGALITAVPPEYQHDGWMLPYVVSTNSMAGDQNLSWTFKKSPGGHCVSSKMMVGFVEATKEVQPDEWYLPYPDIGIISNNHNGNPIYNGRAYADRIMWNRRCNDDVAVKMTYRSEAAADGNGRVYMFVDGAEWIWWNWPANQELRVLLVLAHGAGQITDLLWTGPPAPPA